MARKVFSGISEQSKAAIHRREDAEALFNEKRWRGAMYVAGYAIECTIKARLMSMFEVDHLEDLETKIKQRGLIAESDSLFDHRIELYVRVSGRLDAMRQDKVVWPAFNLANRWIPSWRYNPDRSNMDDAEDFLHAVDTVIQWIRNNI